MQAHQTFPARRRISLSGLLLAMVISACALTDGNEANLGVHKQSLAADTLCNQGAGTTAVVPRWTYTYNDVYGTEGQVQAEIFNNTSTALKVKVRARGRGLDRRDVTRDLWEDVIPANDKHTLLVTIGDFPVQSLYSKTNVTLEAIVTSATNQTHLVGMKVASDTMAVETLPGYALARVSGSDLSQPVAIEGDPATMSLAQFSGQLAAQIPGQLSRAGRVWNGVTMVDVTTLPVTKDTTGTHPLGRAAIPHPIDVSKIATVLDRFPGSAYGAGDTFCFRLPGEYIDDGRGEGISAVNQAARFVRAFISDDQGLPVFNGYLNQNGCTTNFTAVSGRSYFVIMRTTLAANGRTISVRDASGNTTIETLAFTLNGTTKFRAQLSTFTLGARTLPTLMQMLRLGIASTAAGPRLVELPTGSYTVITDKCDNSTEDEERWPACARGNTLRLGPNPDGTHNVDWKFVVTHEVGHMIQDSLSGAPLKVTDYDVVDPNPLCRCTHVQDLNDQTHCMQSKEFIGGAETEAFAHLAAANTWNPASATACQFVYYKNLFVDGAVVSPPYAVDCTVKAKWLENNCLEPSRGVEWDWMNWKRSVATAPANEQSSMADIAAIYKQACGGISCSGITVTPAQLIATARVKYGTGTPRAIRFERDVVDYGANH